MLIYFNPIFTFKAFTQYADDWSHISNVYAIYLLSVNCTYFMSVGMFGNVDYYDVDIEAAWTYKIARF